MASCDSTRPSAMGQVNLFGNPLEKEKTKCHYSKHEETFRNICIFILTLVCSGHYNKNTVASSSQVALVVKHPMQET